MNNRIRIIGGAWRGRILRFPALPGLRPTPDRVRETLFNWLGQDLTGRVCLELFAGSGAMSFEALSRGAARAVCVERDVRSVARLHENAALLGARALEIHRADVIGFLRADSRRYDVIFIDPPYQEDWPSVLWPLLRPRLADEGWVYLETPAALAPPPGWEVWRQDRAGKVHYHLLRSTGH